MDLIDAVIGLVAVIHAVFAVLEWTRWDRVTGLLTDFDEPTVDATRVLGGNFAIYNLMIAIGLAASTFLAATPDANVQMWLLGSIMVVGVYGGATMKGPLLYIAQVAPAVIALIMLAAS